MQKSWTSDATKMVFELILGAPMETDLSKYAFTSILCAPREFVLGLIRHRQLEVNFKRAPRTIKMFFELIPCQRREVVLGLILYRQLEVKFSAHLEQSRCFQCVVCFAMEKGHGSDEGGLTLLSFFRVLCLCSCGGMHP